MEESTEAVSPDVAFAAVYERLRALARRQRRGAGYPDTLNTTALVHEVYLEFAREREERIAPRDFFAYAARAMRHLLIDRARRNVRVKHGGHLRREELDHELTPDPGRCAAQTLELDDALRRLAAEEPRAAEIVELHYFAGLTFERIAELLGLSERTVMRDWRFARAWLHGALAS